MEYSIIDYIKKEYNVDVLAGEDCFIIRHEHNEGINEIGVDKYDCATISYKPFKGDGYTFKYAPHGCSLSELLLKATGDNFDDRDSMMFSLRTGR